MKTHAIVICGGDGTRWNEHMGIDKHFAEVDGKPLIRRTLRQLSRYEDAEKYVIAKKSKVDMFKEITDKYKSALLEPKNIDGAGDANKFISSRNLWNEEGRTIIFYGDVFFTEEAIEKIMKNDYPVATMFARPFDSKFTGKPYGECFAISFGHHQNRIVDAALRRIVHLYNTGIIDRCGGWELYKALENFPDSIMNRHVVGTRLSIIDDFTDDFDSPEEYNLFLTKYNEFRSNSTIGA